MTDTELDQAIGIEIFGWEKYNSGIWLAGKNSRAYSLSMAELGWDIKSDGLFDEVFSPTNDWNHWRQVEEKIMQDERMTTAFTNILTDHLPEDTPLLVGFETMWKTYAGLDLRTRCLAALSAVRSLKQP